MRHSIEANSCRRGHAFCGKLAAAADDDCCAQQKSATDLILTSKRKQTNTGMKMIMNSGVSLNRGGCQSQQCSTIGHELVKTFQQQRRSTPAPQLLASIKFVIVVTTLSVLLLLLAHTQVPCNAQETRPIELSAAADDDITRAPKNYHNQDGHKDQRESSSSAPLSRSSSDSSDEHDESTDSLTTTTLTTSTMLDEHDNEEDEPLKLSTRLPRQHFRLKVGPTKRASSAFRLVNIRRRAATSSTSTTKQPAPKTNCSGASEGELGGGDQQAGVNREPTNSAAGEGDGNGSNKSQKRPPKANTKKISSAALKKLLIHTLPRLDSSTTGTSGTSNQSPASGSVIGPSKGPNFKFVFIQRATRVPASSSNSSASLNKKTTGSNKTNGVTSSTSATKQPQQQQQQQAPQQSLAASVSRQLASSLFYSAANFIQHNLTSAATSAAASNLIPSLSALAALSSGRPAVSSQADHQSSLADNELVRPSTTLSTTTSAAGPFKVIGGTNEDANGNQVDKDETFNSILDIRRLSRPSSSPSSLATTTTSQQQQQQHQATKTKPKKSRPSKIYNLPVKFVSNGQPNSVMFQSIKQHFATIKKLQQQQTGSSNKLMSGAFESSGSQGKKKKPAGSGQTRLKGTNSRLIYLPLKYLSNAKPSMLSKMVSGGSGGGSGSAGGIAAPTKASHKSSSSLLGTKSIRSH